MKKVKVYLDTSIISYLYQQDSKEKMETTKKVWEILKGENFEVCISKLVIFEIEGCLEPKKSILKNYIRNINLNYLDDSKTSLKIKEQLLSFQVLSKRSSSDCTHISLALANNCNYILSWNFRHFVNPKTIQGVNKLSQFNNLNNVNIVSPDIFLIYIKEGVIK